MTDAAMTPALLTVEEAARLLRISKRQYYVLADKGEVPRPRKVHSKAACVRGDDIAAIVDRWYPRFTPPKEQSDAVQTRESQDVVGRVDGRGRETA